MGRASLGSHFGFEESFIFTNRLTVTMRKISSLLAECPGQKNIIQMTKPQGKRMEGKQTAMSMSLALFSFLLYPQTGRVQTISKCTIINNQHTAGCSNKCQLLLLFLLWAPSTHRVHSAHQQRRNHPHQKTAGHTAMSMFGHYLPTGSNHQQGQNHPRQKTGRWQMDGRQADGRGCHTPSE